MQPFSHGGRPKDAAARGSVKVSATMYVRVARDTELPAVERTPKFMAHLLQNIAPATLPNLWNGDVRGGS
jgi:hypothetical protein